MIALLKKFPLSTRLIFIGAMFCINYVLFPVLASMLLLPFCGMDKVQSIFAGNIVTQSDKYIFLFVQGFASLGAFVFTSLLLAQLETRFVAKRMALGVTPAMRLVVMAVFAVLVAQVFIQFLVEMNQKIPLPDFFKVLIEQGKKQEAMEKALLQGGSILIFIVNVLVLAIIPAIGEEFFFRGLVLGDLLQSKINPVFSIAVTGLLFSIAHQQPDNFLAIWVLGCFLGFLYYISGSIWLSIAAHFVNNILVVVLQYLFSSGYLKTDISEAEMPLYVTLISFALFGGCLFVLNKWRRNVDFSLELDEPEPLNEEEDYI